MTRTENNIPRRSFLLHIILGWISIIFLPILYVILQYLLPPRLRESILEKVIAGKLSDFPDETGKIIKFNKVPVIIINTKGKFRAFNARCTHLGCIVEYQSNVKEFVCNCHGSRFDITGKNIGGPAPKPLEPLKVDVKDSDIILSQV